MINAIYTIAFCKLLIIKRFGKKYFCGIVTAINFRGTSTPHCKQAYSYYCREKNTKYLNRMTITTI
jgi:hypothetical protein